MTKDGVSHIKEKVMALLRKAADGAATPAEAEGAMAAARKLMAKHSLSEDEVTASTADDYVDVTVCPKTTRTGMAYVDPVVRYCARTVAEFCGCVVYVKTDLSVIWSGLASDVDMAQWMVEAFRDQLEHDWLIFKRHDLGTKRMKDITDARVSFVHGFTRAIAARLSDWMYRTPLTGETPDTSTALVVKKANLALARLAGMGMHLGGSVGHRGAQGCNAAAAGAGHNAGAAASMGRGMGNTGAVRMIGVN